MNDTHGVSGKEWIGFDLDGTLAKYDGWKGIAHIGEPVKPMVDLIKKLHAEGKVVKILTARVAPRPNPEKVRNPYVGRLNPPYADEYVKSQYVSPSGIYSLVEWTAKEFIEDWCLKNLGFMPKVTYEKDQLMAELYDDRVKQVIPNKGELVEDDAAAMSDAMIRVHDILQGADANNWADCIRQAQVELSEFI